MKWKPPSSRHRERARGAPRWLARIGAPALIALGCALGMLTLLFCALVAPGFVRPADAGTTVSTQAVPGDATPPVPDTIQPAPAEPSAGQRLVTLPWGDGAGEVGLAQPAEGLTRGPEALAVAPDGRIAVLDSVNSRLVLLAADGSFSGALPVSLSQPRFLAVDDGLIYVLDAEIDRQLLCLDWQGAQIHSAQLPALDDVVTGLFATADGPCVEVAHDQVFAIEFKDSGKQAGGSGMASASGQPVRGQGPAAALHVIAGRPVDRDLAKAAKVSFKPKDGVKLKHFRVDKKTFKGVQTRVSALNLPQGKAIEHLVSVDGDGQGGLIIGARLLGVKGDPKDRAALIVGRLAADQTDAVPVLSDTLTLVDSPFAYLGQPYVVAPDGRILQPVGSDAGYTIIVYLLPGSTPPVSVGTTAPEPAIAPTGEVKP